MLARAVDDLPSGAFLYEPKWDGARCIASVARHEAELVSRSAMRVDKGFPEVTAGLERLDVRSATLDGELLVARDGQFSFSALLSRLNATAMDTATTSIFMAFDLLELDGADLVAQPLSHRRRALEQLVGSGTPGVTISPATTDREVAELWFSDFVGPGIDGVVAKRLDWPYTPGRRTMFKQKRRITIDCVIGGARKSRGGYASLLLGLFDDSGELVYVGSCSGFTGTAERKAAERLRALECGLEGHPWRSLRRRTEWTPLRPRQVCEVSSTHYEHRRLRSPATLLRWRDDRDPSSCRIDQLEPAIERSRP